MSFSNRSALLISNVGVVAAAFWGMACTLTADEAAQVKEVGISEVEMLLGENFFQLQPGVELEVEVTMPKDRVGEWELACFVPGHYEAGMHVPVNIRGEK